MRVPSAFALMLLSCLVVQAARADEAALVSALSALRAAVASPASCTDLRACPRAWTQLDRAVALLERDALTPAQVSRALNVAATGIAILERFALTDGALAPLVAGALDAVRARVGELQAAAGTEVAKLCTSVSPRGQRLLGSGGRTLERAELQAADGKDALALRFLGRALALFGRTQLVATRLAKRCSPPACRFEGAPGFTPGDPANPALSLILPDRGTQLDYAIGALDTRIIFLGLSRFRSLEPSFLAGLSGKIARRYYTTARCTDAAGWVRFANVREVRRLLLREWDDDEGDWRWTWQAWDAIRFGLSPESVASPAAALDFGLFPLPLSARTLRVGDRLEQTDVQLRGVVSGTRVNQTCDVTHRVAGIEAVAVAAGTFEAARVESTLACRSNRTGALEEVEVTTWLASRVGQVRAEAHQAGMLVHSLELSCAEFPETRGSCGNF